MKFQQWNMVSTPQTAVDELTSAGYSWLVSSVLASRGIASAEEAAAFLERDRSLSHSPFLMKDMDRAVERISRAIADDERIAVFGDYDVDGITATCILMDYLASRGADCLHYIPRRIEDGYGLGKDAILSLHRRGVNLIVTVDCGITGVEEVAYARSLGMDVVVTDHHECKDALPDAAAVVDPHRSDCPYPFKHLAGCGVALKLVLALGGRDREEALFARYCTLAAIGTVADVMQMSDENRTIVSRGLESIGHSDFIGLHALLQEAGLADKAVTSVQIGFVLAPRINAAGRMGEADMAADLLLCSDPHQAATLARQLCALNRERQNVEQEIFTQTLEIIEQMPADQRSALVLASDEWHQGVVGVVASRLSEKYSCPSFMIHLTGHVGKGSCRSWGGFNLFSALESCSDLLLGFGGHELAAGFTIEEKNIPAFRTRMNQYARAYRGGEAPVSSLDVDVVLTQPGRVTLEEVEALDALEPYGAGNGRPVFCLRGATLERAQNVGQNRHLKLRLSKGSAQFDGIFFSAVAQSCGVEAGSRVDAAFYLQVNEFRGSRSVQLQMVDIRPSLCCSAREEESLRLVERCLAREDLKHKEAQRLLPSREQHVRAWRVLQHLIPADGITTPYLPLLRRLASAIGGTEPFGRAAICLEVFRERSLLSLQRRGDEVRLKLQGQEKKVSLEHSIYLQHLADILETTKRGGMR
ncbi:MAG: single-stranded-DNA-specific exonuclease RecJ [Oscillospiraceae bacterium]|nr:single-stranded-DNA-specific exonuclease RecJ [Oscillospiraceae bacterium]